MKDLELLAPARNADIGIAAIDCGADAVYIAGPGFGARQAAGNSIEEIARLCNHAHRYGARVFVTINTIIYDSELEAVRSLVKDVTKAGADALIVQDMAMLALASEAGIPLHASTQCAIRTPQKAAALSSLGFSRLILERELSLEQIASISQAAPECEIEFFVHGALCVCYSGQCYLSENIAGRSANRGACIQACRSRYDLVDESGKVLVKDKALLSLKDYRLLDRLEELADAGVSSFKIEGRLKNESYVRNVVRQYSLALDRLVASRPEEYRRASFGKVVNGFTPALDKTFNRGYTELFIEGHKERGWAAMDAAKGMGEEIGKVVSARTAASTVIEVETPLGCRLANGDGFAFVSGRGDAIGFRGDVCEQIRPGLARIVCKSNDLIYKGARLYRNLDANFEKELLRNPSLRLLDVTLDVNVRFDSVSVCATSEDGREIARDYILSGSEEALNIERLQNLVQSQLSKTSDIFRFSISSLSFEAFPLLSAAFLNGIRRDISDALNAVPCRKNALLSRPLPPFAASLSGKAVEHNYKANIANLIARSIYGEGEDAYELSHPEDAELMRTRYCIRKELGMCLMEGAAPKQLYLLNNGRTLALHFDCKACEMVIKSAKRH